VEEKNQKSFASIFFTVTYLQLENGQKFAISAIYIKKKIRG